MPVHGRVRKLLSFEKSGKTVLQFDLQEEKTSSNILKIYRNIYRKNISAIIYRYRCNKLRYIDYRYRPGLF